MDWTRNSPVPLAMAASWDPSLAEKSQAAAAEEAMHAGIRWTFAPMLDIARDRRWGRISEGAGEDPYLGAAMARAQVLGRQGSQAQPKAFMATLKHFAGYGEADGGRDYDAAYIPEEPLAWLELAHMISMFSSASARPNWVIPEPPLASADSSRGWHSHHIIPKVLGGSDGVMNRQLLHPGCHRQLHSNLAASASASLTRRSGRLEPWRWKLSRTVLRGAVGGDTDCLLDLQRPSLPQPPPDEPGERGLFGEMAAPIKPAAKPKAGSRPVYKFEMPDGRPFALAGLFSEWRPRTGSSHQPLDTFSIVTTEANELTESIHDRMPVILHRRDYDRWLNDYEQSRPPIDLLRPYESEGMRMTLANRMVGDVRNNGPEMLNSA